MSQEDAVPQFRVPGSHTGLENRQWPSKSLAGSNHTPRRFSLAQGAGRLPQQACNTSLWSQTVGSASAAVITSTSR